MLAPLINVRTLYAEQLPYYGGLTYFNLHTKSFPTVYDTLGFGRGKNMLYSVNVCHFDC